MTYSKSSKIIHWLMALLIIFLLGLGIYMEEFLAKESSNRMEIYNLHKSLGVLAIILIFTRIANRIIHKAPAPLKTLKNWEKTASHAAHILLYILMVIIPISGYLMSNSFGYQVKFFGIELPFLVEKNFEIGKIFAKTHTYSAFSILGIITIHILGVIKHRFFDNKENDVLKRMI